MGDGLNLTQDKRHKSSSSIAGVVLDGTRSERKLDINTSIAEVDDQFALAESRCNDLQEKIDLVRMLKRNKKKFKKKSLTRVNEVPLSEPMPFISVRTQPKKNVTQQAARMRRLDVPPNPTRGYLDPATVEQHRMLRQVRGYNQNYNNKKPFDNQYEQKMENYEIKSDKTRARRSCADGDGRSGEAVNTSSTGGIMREEITGEYSDDDLVEHFPGRHNLAKRQSDIYKDTKTSTKWRNNIPHEGHKDVTKWTEDAADYSKEGWRAISSPVYRRRHMSTKLPQNNSNQSQKQMDERPVVELFNKSKPTLSPLPRKPQQSEKRTKKQRETQKMEDQTTGPLEYTPPLEVKKPWAPRRVKYRSRRYELPTVASQMKQTGIRYYYGTSNHTNIPFVVSKSTAPSHNIGINIQQVLNGLKIQQPLSGIPLTIAHHMGLGHIPTYGAKNTVPRPLLDNHEINAIKLGQHLLRLPSYKYMSYNRLLNLYREGDGMVSRFLRAISRPHYFYTSMYNLATNREDLDGATSKGRGGSQEAKQSLAEYASLYREYEQIEKCLNEGNYDPELERRKDELTKELASREEHIRKVVQDYRTGPESEQAGTMTGRPATSTTEDPRHSTFKLNQSERIQ